MFLLPGAAVAAEVGRPRRLCTPQEIAEELLRIWVRMRSLRSRQTLLKLMRLDHRNLVILVVVVLVGLQALLLRLVEVMEAEVVVGAVAQPRLILGLLAREVLVVLDFAWWCRYDSKNRISHIWNRCHLDAPILGNKRDFVQDHVMGQWWWRRRWRLRCVEREYFGRRWWRLG